MNSVQICMYILSHLPFSRVLLVELLEGLCVHLSGVVDILNGCVLPISSLSLLEFLFVLFTVLYT